MPKFEKPKDWGVADSSKWVSGKPLDSSKGMPQLGDPEYSENSSTTFEYEEDRAAKALPGVKKPKKAIAGGKFVAQCPPGQIRQGNICISNPESEAILTRKSMPKLEKEEEDDGEIDSQIRKIAKEGVKGRLGKEGKDD